MTYCPTNGLRSNSDLFYGVFLQSKEWRSLWKRYKEFHTPKMDNVFEILDYMWRIYVKIFGNS